MYVANLAATLHLTNGQRARTHSPLQKCLCLSRSRPTLCPVHTTRGEATSPQHTRHRGTSTRAATGSARATCPRRHVEVPIAAAGRPRPVEPARRDPGAYGPEFDPKQGALWRGPWLSADVCDDGSEYKKSLFLCVSSCRADTDIAVVDEGEGYYCARSDADSDSDIPEVRCTGSRPDRQRQLQCSCLPAAAAPPQLHCPAQLLPLLPDEVTPPDDNNTTPAPSPPFQRCHTLPFH